MVHLATRTRLLGHHLQHKKRAFNAPLQSALRQNMPQSSSQQASKARLSVNLFISILHNRSELCNPILLQCESIGCILPYGRCGSLNQS